MAFPRGVRAPNAFGDILSNAYDVQRSSNVRHRFRHVLHDAALSDSDQEVVPAEWLVYRA